MFSIFFTCCKFAVNINQSTHLFFSRFYVYPNTCSPLFSAQLDTAVIQDVNALLLPSVTLSQRSEPEKMSDSVSYLTKAQLQPGCRATANISNSQYMGGSPSSNTFPQRTRIMAKYVSHWSGRNLSEIKAIANHPYPRT